MQNDSDLDTNVTSSRYLVPGAPVFDAGGDKVGSVSDHQGMGQYIVVQQGVFFTHDVYVPMNAVARADADGIYLNLYKDDLKAERYKTIPGADVMGNAAVLTSDAETIRQERGSRVMDEERMHARPAATRRSTIPRQTDRDDIEVLVREEELVAEKRREEIGHVRLHKEVVEERETVNVPVTHEEVRVERVPVTDERAAADLGPDAWQEKEIDVPLMGERVAVEKEAHVAEEIHLHKQAVTDQQRVADTVKKERVQIEGVDEQGRPLNLSPDDMQTGPPARRP